MASAIVRQFRAVAAPSDLLAVNFPFDPTLGQQQFFANFERFWKLEGTHKPTLLLRGYAGTGKTTLVGTLVKSLPALKYKAILLAPTGRAAKVLSSYSGINAFTIHKLIYQPRISKGGGIYFQLQKNFFNRTLFIVDEASMLSDEAEYGQKSLLEDLVEYVFSHPSNKLMLIGDGAQLPPVKKVESPALKQDYLETSHGLAVIDTELTEVMRQQQESGILWNATNLRSILFQKEYNIRFRTTAFPDIFKMTGERLEDGLRYAYDKYGVEDTIIVVRSNKSAVGYNEYIRRTIHYFESELEAGDMLMIVRNNYFFVPEDSPAGFLANGDFMEVMRIVGFEDLHGFRFANLEVRLLDYPDQENLSVKVILDTLHSATPNMTREENQKLFDSVSQDYLDITNRQERMKAIREDPYLNALQIKFAYALTCHKSQGGQWSAVFVDQGYLPEEQIDREYIRWLYTATTRAQKELFLVNFHPNFFR